MMQAMRLRAYGAPLSLETLPAPKPGPEEIALRVRAASVNPVDWKVRDGMLRERIPLELPLTLGGDCSGTIVALGESVSEFKIGDDVFLMTERANGYAFGAFATHVVAPAANAASKPVWVTHADAAASGLAALTAWQGLFDRGGLKAGERVLIHAGAGGVGHFAIQFARDAGAHVVTTASARNHDFVREFGAHEVIDHAAAPFETAVRDIDLVLDLVGGEVQTRSFAVLRPGGRLVNSWGALAEPPSGISAAKVAVTPNGAQLREIAGRLQSGALKAHVDAIFPLAEADRALDRNRAGGGRGKLVLLAPE